jgi:hypothetical protein
MYKMDLSYDPYPGSCKTLLHDEIREKVDPTAPLCPMNDYLGLTSVKLEMLRIRLNLYKKGGRSRDLTIVNLIKMLYPTAPDPRDISALHSDDTYKAYSGDAETNYIHRSSMQEVLEKTIIPRYGELSIESSSENSSNVITNSLSVVSFWHKISILLHDGAFRDRDTHAELITAVIMKTGQTANAYLGTDDDVVEAVYAALFTVPLFAYGDQIFGYVYKNPRLSKTDRNIMIRLIMDDEFRAESKKDERYTRVYNVVRAVLQQYVD